MKLDNPEHRSLIETAFPLLGADTKWKISSPRDGTYNCIAFAAIKNTIWWWPENTDLDGVEWPYELPQNTDLVTFQELFRRHNYEICSAADFEKGFQKIAIYTKDGGNYDCTHAARQNNKGIWLSKLGPEWDIEHKDPYSIEGTAYGKVACIMKRMFS